MQVVVGHTLTLGKVKRGSLGEVTDAKSEFARFGLHAHIVVIPRQIDKSEVEGVCKGGGIVENNA